MNFIQNLLAGVQLLKFGLRNEEHNPLLMQLNHNELLAGKQASEDNLNAAIQKDLIQKTLIQNLVISQQQQLLQSMIVQNEIAPMQPKSKKISKRTNTCGHLDREHYAKGLCNNCYHRFGRDKKPWLCSHSKLYAQGLCQNCYINKYNKNRRKEESACEAPDIQVLKEEEE